MPRRAIETVLVPATPFVLELYRAGGGLELAGDAFEKSALSGAIRSDQAAQFAVADGEIDAAQHFYAAEPHPQTFCLDDRLGAHCAGRR
jgi:hypothetical protein